jgi:signal transduction histidine kinase
MYLKITKGIIPLLDRAVKTTFIDHVSMDDVLSLVRNLPDSSLIFIPGFNTDSKKVFYYNPEAIHLISQAAKAPVFSISDMGFGEGATGGYILSFKKTGLLAGDIAIYLLDGHDPNLVRVNESDYYEQMYDWRMLKRWNLTGSKRIPKGSHIEFEQTNFFLEYKWFITAGIVFLILQFLLILNLARFNRKQKMITRQLIETENKYRELVNEDRILRLSQLSASLSHELNQPLTAILSTAQAGLRFIESGKNDPELMKEILGNIVEDDKRTASILSSLRGMLKLEKREKEVIHLNLLIEETILIYTGESIRKNISFELSTVDPPVYVIADKIQIQQVVMNLIQNSVQSIENAGAKTRKIVITEKLDNDMVIVSVRDFGEGISEVIREKIFKPFVTSKKEGTGIGLAISRSIIDDHHGKIWAENMPDGGAIFSFSLKTFNNEKLL